jgi:hypothetical protein
MKTADEMKAYRLSEKAKKEAEVIENEVPKLEKAIEEAAKANCETATVYYMSDVAKKVLEENGYNVKVASSWQDTTYIISGF